MNICLKTDKQNSFEVFKQKNFLKIDNFYIQKCFGFCFKRCVALFIGSVVLLSIELPQVIFGVVYEGCLILCAFSGK